MKKNYLPTDWKKSSVLPQTRNWVGIGHLKI